MDRILVAVIGASIAYNIGKRRCEEKASLEDDHHQREVAALMAELQSYKNIHDEGYDVVGPAAEQADLVNKLLRYKARLEKCTCQTAGD